MKQKISLRAILVLAIGIFPGLLWAGTSQTFRMKIEGMTCGMCKARMEKQLSFLCKEVTIDREKGEGLCRYETPVTPDQILAEANKTGFKTTKVN